MSEPFLEKGESLCCESDELLYGAVEVDDVARVAFELETAREKAYRITFPVALWRLGAFSVFVALLIEAGGIWFRQRFLYHDDEI
mmetsp:Transcript_20036/g.62985  ORF Transcript_20036/g.62985 Transcript_20036/m.62985 type:complete len:85 (-) Transcript_20036:191-445(-)